jgi:activating signal cointegrator complex subunit 1
MPRTSPLDYFLCLPLVTDASRPQLESSLDQFTSADDGLAALVDRDQQQISARAVRPVGTLHLTLGVMSLQNPEKINSAIELLHSLDLEAMLGAAVSQPTTGDVSAENQPTKDEKRPLSISLKGLTSMHSPHDTSILYSNPEDSSGRLQPFASALQKAFQDAGFVQFENRPLLLHATIVNTTYIRGRAQQASRSRGGSVGHGKHKAKITFDARELISDYEDFYFVKDMRLEKVAICKMGAKKDFDNQGQVIDEKYEVLAERHLPQTS